MSTVTQLLERVAESDGRAWAARRRLLDPFNRTAGRRFLTKGERRKLCRGWEALPAYGRLGPPTAEQSAEGGVHLVEERCQAAFGELIVVRRTVWVAPQISLGFSDHGQRIGKPVPAAHLAERLGAGLDDAALFAEIARNMPLGGRYVYRDQLGRICVAVGGPGL